MKTICIYHGGCADGFTAAWVVARAAALRGIEIEFVAAQYQQPPPDVTGKRVIMVDFSYKRAELVAMLAQCESLLIIDHHKTARPEIEAVAGDAKLTVMFDLERSGAGLAWDHFFPGVARPRLVDLVEDRDLWRFDKADSREVHAYLMSHRYGFETWSTICDRLDDDTGAARIAEAGEAIDRAHLKNIRELIASASYIGNITGYAVPILNAPYFMASDAGNIMAEGHAFAACWFSDGKVDKYSLRSKKGGADVSEIAQLWGGGGHARAAGFAVAHGTGVALRPGLASAMLGEEGRF